MPFFYAFSIRQSVVRLMPRLCACLLYTSLARSCVFDADTGRELTRAELEHIEPVPGPLSAQRRESRVYGAVYALEGTDSGSAVAVEVDGALLRAEAERRAPGAS